MFGLLVKVVGSHAVDQGSIPGSLQLRQKCDVGQKLNFVIFVIPGSSQLRQKCDVGQKLKLCNSLNLKVFMQFYNKQTKRHF